MKRGRSERQWLVFAADKRANDIMAACQMDFHLEEISGVKCDDGESRPMWEVRDKSFYVGLWKQRQEGQIAGEFRFYYRNGRGKARLWKFAEERIRTAAISRGEAFAIVVLVP